MGRRGSRGVSFHLSGASEKTRLTGLQVLVASTLRILQKYLNPAAQVRGSNAQLPPP